MLRNNADARRCSYFEVGLPVISLINVDVKIVKKMLPVRPKSLSARTQQNRLVVAISNAVILSLASSIEDTCIHPSYAIASFEKPAKIFNH